MCDFPPPAIATNKSNTEFEPSDSRINRLIQFSANMRQPLTPDNTQCQAKSYHSMCFVLFSSSIFQDVFFSHRKKMKPQYCHTFFFLLLSSIQPIVYNNAYSCLEFLSTTFTDSQKLTNSILSFSFIHFIYQKNHSFSSIPSRQLLLTLHLINPIPVI